MAATVVPHDPAPITATTSSEPTVGSIRGPMFRRRRPCPHRRVRSIPIQRVRAGKARLAGFARRRRARRARRGDGPNRWCAPPAPLPVVVVSTDPEVRDWAARLGVEVLDDPGHAQRRRRRRARPPRRTGCSRVVVAHADLPPPATSPGSRATARSRSSPWCPCHRDDGTPCSRVPADGRLPLRLRRRVVPPPRRRGAAARPGGARRARRRPRVRRRRPRRPRRAGRGAPNRRVVTTDRRRAPGPRGPRHRRPPRRRRVRVRRDARQVGRGRVRRRTSSCSPTARRAAGTRRSDTRRSSPPAAGRAARRRRARSAPGECTSSAGSTASSRPTGPAASRCATGSGPSAPTSCSATTPGSGTASTPTTATPAASRSTASSPPATPTSSPTGRHPHRPTRLLLFEADEPDHVEDVTEAYIDAKVDALLCHQSQWRSTMGIDEGSREEPKTKGRLSKHASRTRSTRQAGSPSSSHRPVVGEFKLSSD